MTKPKKPTELEQLVNAANAYAAAVAELEQLRTMRAKVRQLSLAMRAAWKYDEKDHVSYKWFRQLHAILNPSNKV